MAIDRRLRIVSSGTEGASMSTTVKVAFATTDLKRVNQHFGSARSLAVYGVSPDASRLVEVLQFGSQDQDGNEDKLTAKFEALDGCAAVYCKAVGSSAIRQLMTLGVQPVRVSGGVFVSGLIESLQDELRQGPSAWLAKAIARNKPSDPERFAAMEADGWVE